MQRYIAEEIATAHVAGMLSRREAFSRLAVLGVGTATATALITNHGEKRIPFDDGFITADDAAAARIAVGAAAEMSLVQSHNSAPNLLMDGSYELDSTWWAGEMLPGRELSTEAAYLGFQSLKITGPTTHYPNVTSAGRSGADIDFSIIQSEAGRIYRLSFMVRRPATNTQSGYVRGLLYLKGQAVEDILGGVVTNQQDISAETWIPYTFTFVVPVRGDNLPYIGVYPAIATASVDAADILYVDAVRFEDITDAPVELLAPPPTGNREVDTANVQALIDAAQLNRGTVVLRAGTYAVDLVTAKTYKQPRIVGQGKQYTLIDGTIKFQGVSSKFSGGWMSGFTFVGSHPGKAAIELNGVCDVHWDEVRVYGTYDIGLLFHNELAGDYTEVCNGAMSFYATVDTAVKYQRGAGDSSFHGSGLMGSSEIQHIGTGPAIYIGPGARPYNAPMSVRVWSGSSKAHPVVQHDGDPQSNFYGDIQFEQTDVVPLAAGNIVYFAGTLAGYMGRGLGIDYGTFLLVSSLEAVSEGTLSIGPLAVNKIVAGGADGANDLVLEPTGGGGVRFGSDAGPGWYSGTGSPEGVVVASPGSFYSNVSGGAGTTFYVKESGTDNIGWVSK